MENLVENSERYDRQLRLWGSGGQARLGASSICLLGASAAGAEALKNLVLPGVGAFTIVDGRGEGEHRGGCFFQAGGGYVHARFFFFFFCHS
jgi:amyloid beta precursor protein binding protein 1